MNTLATPQAIIRQIVVARDAVAKELADGNSYGGPDPAPNQTTERVIRKQVLDEVLVWIEDFEAGEAKKAVNKAIFAASKTA